MHAMSSGYRAGKAAEPLFGVDWDELWDVPLDEVRARFAVEPAGFGVSVEPQAVSVGAAA